MYKVYCRVFQFCMKVLSYLLPWREPILLQGEGCILKLPEFMREKGLNKVLIVTDQGIAKIGLMDSMLKALDQGKMAYVVYDKTVPNPTIDNIEEAYALYKKEKCNGLIAFGGGSSMDCAKGVAARAANPKKTVRQMKGLFKVRKKLPDIIAIPTTSGTGSEATVAAVITDSKTHEKYAMNDIVLIPRYAVLDPVLTEKLPPNITSTTGMDALTHAVEAYIGRSNTKRTRELSRKAVKLIFDNIYEAYSNGSNLTARENMQKASYYAGAAFTRAYVGNAHAVAHTLGGFYSTPHGLANAVILPYILDTYGSCIYKKLAELSDLTSISEKGDNEEQKAKKFILHIREMNKSMNIPDKIKGISEKDIPVMSKRAEKEANPVYPVPVILSKDELAKIYYLIME